MRKIVLPLLLALITTGAFAQTKVAKTKTKTLKGKSVKTIATPERLTEEEMDGQSPADEAANAQPVDINLNKRAVAKPEPSPITTAGTTAAPSKLGVYAADDENGGAIIQDVAANSPAERAGLKAGDVIIKINNQIIGNANELMATMTGYNRGDEVAIYFERANQPATAVVKLGSGTSTVVDNFDPGNQPPEFSSSSSYSGEYPRHYEYNDVRMVSPYGTNLGIRGVEVNKGIKVTVVRLGSPADRAGLRSGDIITRLDGERVWYGDDLGRVLQRTGDKVLLEFLRHNSLYTTELRQTNYNPR